MALPHYKLHTNPLPEVPTAFPVLLAPSEPPLRFAFFKRILRSRALLIGLQVLFITAGAVLLWLWLDPTTLSPQPIHLLIPAITLGACVALLILIALVKNNPDPAETEAAPDIPLPIPPPITPVPRPTHNSFTPSEWNLEQWSSRPFVEVLDDAVMAEVLDDDLVAPDYLVLSVNVQE